MMRAQLISCAAILGPRFLKDWLRLGGRRIDTAYAYADQTKIGQALADSGLKREDVFITSKMPLGGYEQRWVTHFDSHSWPRWAERSHPLVDPRLQLGLVA